MAFGRETETNWVCKIAICHCDRRTNTEHIVMCVVGSLGPWGKFKFSRMTRPHRSIRSSEIRFFFWPSNGIDLEVMDCAIVHHSRPVNVTRVTRPLLCMQRVPLVKILFFCCQINYEVFIFHWIGCFASVSYLLKIPNHSVVCSDSEEHHLNDRFHSAR